MNEAEKIDKPQGNGVLPCVSSMAVLSSKILKTIYTNNLIFYSNGLNTRFTK